jgi:hypothetical protein
VPDAKPKVYGVVPPDALTVAEYALPTVPAGRLEVVIDSGTDAGAGTGAAATDMLSALVAFREAASVTFTVKLNVPDCVGVPQSEPLVESFTPAGSMPEARLKLYGVVPPDAVMAVEYAVPDVAEAKLDVVIVSGEIAAAT